MTGTVDVQSMLFDYVERVRTLLSPDTWGTLGMDLSKNDLLTLLFLYRTPEARMSDLADYLRSPLNTTTGVVGRLERRGYVERRHDPADKRIVKVALSATGRDFATRTLGAFAATATRVLDGLTEEQLRLLLTTFDRVIELIAADERAAAKTRTVRRIAID